MSVIKLPEKPRILSGASVVGQKEFDGPLGAEFDIHDKTSTFGMDTWEKSESEMQRIAVNTALSKANLSPNDIDAMFAGDLLNQCAGSSYGLISFQKPCFGIYGACSTFAEGIVLSSVCVGKGYYKKCVVSTSSHFCSAERQFRFPLEYGGQRPPTAQRTVTAAGAVVVSLGGDGPRIIDVMAGTPVDGGVTDANNMGAAMAPAAADTFVKYFKDTGTSPSDYDLILTGDLGREGHSIMRELMRDNGYDMDKNSNDCGMLIYNCKEQDVHSGGSGCGCSASVFCAYVLKKMKKRELNDVIFASTGALMSPDSLKQGNSIPGIAHLFHIRNTEV